MLKGMNLQNSLSSSIAREQTFARIRALALLYWHTGPRINPSPYVRTLTPFATDLKRGNSFQSVPCAKLLWFCDAIANTIKPGSKDWNWTL